MGLLDKYKKTEVILTTNKFESKFDYSNFLTEDKEKLIELEKKANHTGNLLKENLKELGDIFTEAQSIFANNKNGSFGIWYENLGFKKDFVYLCLERKALSLKYKTEDVYSFPDRMIKDIKKISKTDNIYVDEIFEANNPKEKVIEIKENLFKHISNSEDTKEKRYIEKRLNLISNILKNQTTLSKNKFETLNNLLDTIEEHLKK